MVTNILTVDVEDNFYFEELQFEEDWNKYENQVVDNTLRILDIFDHYKASATFFVVGAVAERHPDLIREIVKRKHHIASHSYKHYPIDRMDENEFRKDLEKSINVLTGITGKDVTGYRAMGYSLRKENVDRVFLDMRKCGIKYDSSINPLNVNEFGAAPVYLEKHELHEFPLSICEVWKMQLPFSGGTYLRLLPYKVIEMFTEKLNNREQPVNVYVHPWEFNKDQPQRNVSLKQKISQHTITFTTEKKLIKLLKKFKFYSIEDYIAAH